MFVVTFNNVKPLIVWSRQLHQVADAVIESR